MGSIPPAPSDGETYKAVEVRWSMPQPVQEPCPAASAAASPVKRDQAHCLRLYDEVLMQGSVDLRGAKYGNLRLYAWVPKGAPAPLVNLGGRLLEAQFPANDSTARVCTPQSDCNVIWVPISVNFKVDDTDGALAGFSLTASGPSETYPDVDFALFENITLAYPASPGSPSIELSTVFSGDATSSQTSSPSQPLLTTSIPALQGVLSQTPSKHPSTATLVGIIVTVATLEAILLFSLFLWRRRKMRRLDSSHPTGEPSSNVTPFPIVAAASSILEHPSDGDGLSGVSNDKIVAAQNIISKSSNPPDGSPSDSPPTIEPAESLQLPADELYASPSILPIPASPGHVAQLTAALYRAGLSVNELMSSLERVSRLDVDVHSEAGQGTAEIEAEVLPPRYEA